MESGVSGMIQGRILQFLLNTDHFYPRIYEGTFMPITQSKNGQNTFPAIKSVDGEKVTAM